MQPLLTLIITASFLMSASARVLSNEVTSNEHFIEANGVRLRIWEKFAGTFDGKPIVVLAHGSASAGEGSFDLQLPAAETSYSMMDELARQGFNVFAPDIRGFGRSTRPGAGVTTEEAMSDLDTVIDHVLTIRGAAKVHLVAWSWGTQYAGLEVMAHPEKIARYVAYAQMHANSADIVKRRERLEEFRKAAYMSIPEAAWKKRFTSMTPDSVNEPNVIDAYAKAAAEIETKTPTGPQVDMVTRLPLVDPAKITVPTMVIHGTFDDVADEAGLRPFFSALATHDKSYVIVPDAGHMGQFQKGRGALFHAISEFLLR